MENPFENIYSGFNLGQAPTTDQFDIGNQDFLSPVFGFSSEDAYQSMGAKNSAQRAKALSINQQQAVDDISSGKNYIEDAFKVVEEFNKRIGVKKSDGGIPIPGEPNIRQRMSISGTPYLTISTKPTEHYGLSGELIQDQPEKGFSLGTQDVKWQGPHSWEKGSSTFGYTGNESWNQQYKNPYTGTVIPRGATSENIASQTKKKIFAGMPQSMIA